MNYATKRLHSQVECLALICAFVWESSQENDRGTIGAEYFWRYCITHEGLFSYERHLSGWPLVAQWASVSDHV